MIHLTLTGYGTKKERVLCQQDTNDDDTYWHVMYCSAKQLQQSDVCALCKAIWEE